MRFHFAKAMTALLAAILLCTYLIPAQAEAPAMNVLIIGEDSSPEGQRGRSDVMMLARIDPQADSVKLVSFLRDLYVPIPSVGQTRLNAAYHHGGAALLKETLADCFGVTIDRTVTVRFDTLIELIDRMGGVEITIEPREIGHFNDVVMDYNQSRGLKGGTLREAGTWLLNGKQALCYSRMRKLDSDFQRTSRQQRVIAAMLDKLSTLRGWDLLHLAAAAISQLETDLTFGDVMRLMPMASRLTSLTLDTLTLPVEGGFREETISGMMVLKPDLNVCKRRLAQFLAP